LEKSDSINIVVNKKDSYLKTESPSVKEDSNINKIESSNFNEAFQTQNTTDITIPSFPSSNHKNNPNNIINSDKNNNNKFDKNPSGKLFILYYY